MNYSSRVELYKLFEAKRKKPLLVYVTSLRPNATGQMAGDVVSQFIEQIQRLPTGTKSIDLLLESSGGDPLVSWRVMSLLRERVKKVSVIIPYSAFSAATMLTLGGDEIIMGKYGCLGPIDPQITAKKKDGTTQEFAYEDIVSFLSFTKTEAGLTEQAHLQEAFKLLCDTVEPSALGFAKRASSLSVTIGEKLLQMHMKDSEEKAQAKVIADKLNKSYFSHGHALSREQVKEIGLNVVNATREEETIMWNIHKSFEQETEAASPFNPVSIFLKTPGADIFLQNPPPLNIPPGIDQQTYLAIISQYINAQLQQSIPDVVKEMKWAFVESSRVGYEYKNKLKILLLRTSDLQFKPSIVELESGWHELLPPSNTDVTQ